MRSSSSSTPATGCGRERRPPSARRSPDATAVVLDGEAVIHRAGPRSTPSTRSPRSCGGAATGSASVAEIAADLAVGFGTDTGTVRRDVDSDGRRAGPARAAGAGGRRRTTRARPSGPRSSCSSTHRARARRARTGRGRYRRALSRRRAAPRRRHQRRPRGRSDRRSRSPATSSPEPTCSRRIPRSSRSSSTNRARRVRACSASTWSCAGATVVARSRRADRILRALVANVASYGDLTGLGLAALRGTVVGRQRSSPPRARGGRHRAVPARARGARASPSPTSRSRSSTRRRRARRRRLRASTSTCRCSTRSRSDADPRTTSPRHSRGAAMRSSAFGVPAPAIGRGRTPRLRTRRGRSP